VSFILANQGLNSVITMSVPVLSIVYPVAITSVLLILLARFIPTKPIAQQIPVAVVSIISILSVIHTQGWFKLSLIDNLPLKEYSLDYDLVDSSGPSMTTSLDAAYKNKEPIVVTLWNPHWVFASYDLKYLKDPKNVYGDGDDIVFITRKGFGEDYSEVLGWMNKWLMTDETLGELMATIEKTGDPVEGASIWIEKNRDLIDKWITK